MGDDVESEVTGAEEVDYSVTKETVDRIELQVSPEIFQLEQTLEQLQRFAPPDSITTGNCISTIHVTMWRGTVPPPPMPSGELVGMWRGTLPPPPGPPPPGTPVVISLDIPRSE
jgi:hypothetical protein